MSDPSAEFEVNAELAAERRQRAVIEYMGTSPQIRFGEMPEANLRRWQEALATPTDNPKEIWISGWVDAELAVTCTFKEDGKTVEETRTAIEELLTSAADKFERTRDHNTLPQKSLLRSQATVAAPAMATFATLINNRNPDPAVRRYSAAQATAAKRLLEYYEENQSVEASMWADSLTLISIIFMRGEMLAFPCPPRLSSPYVDSYARQSIILFSDRSFYDVRVGSAGDPTYIHIPYELLGHEKRAQHKLGTLQAVVVLEEAALRMQGRGIKVQSNPLVNTRGGLDDVSRADKIRYIQAGDHAEAVCEEVISRIKAEMMRQTGQEEPPTGPDEWLSWLQPGRNPYIVDPERTDAAISPLELQVLEGTITARDALRLGWLYTEVAFGRVIDPMVPTLQVLGDIDRAEEIFAIALEKTSEENVLELCEASFAHCAAWMQRIVLCNEPLRDEDIDYYKRMLGYMGERAMYRYAELPAGDPEAAALAALMHCATLCLLIMSEGEGAIAVVTPPRQRRHAGWDVTVWAPTLDGFNPREYGRLRITEKEDKSSLSDGIVTITPQHVGEVVKAGKQKQAPFRVFRALSADGMKPQERQAIIKKAWKAVEPRIAATEIV